MVTTCLSEVIILWINGGVLVPSLDCAARLAEGAEGKQTSRTGEEDYRNFGQLAELKLFLQVNKCLAYRKRTQKYITTRLTIE